jgi:hypothetical protein
MMSNGSETQSLLGHDALSWYMLSVNQALAQQIGDGVILLADRGEYDEGTA